MSCLLVRPPGYVLRLQFMKSNFSLTWVQQITSSKNSHMRLIAPFSLPSLLKHLSGPRGKHAPTCNVRHARATAEPCSDDAAKVAPKAREPTGATARRGGEYLGCPAVGLAYNLVVQVSSKMREVHREVWEFEGGIRKVEELPNALHNKKSAYGRIYYNRDCAESQRYQLHNIVRK